MSINNPSFIKTDLKDLWRLAQWLFFIVSQSEASNISTARKGWFLKVLLRLTSVSQPSFIFISYWCIFSKIYRYINWTWGDSYLKKLCEDLWLMSFCLSGLYFVFSFFFSKPSAARGPSQTAGHLWLFVSQPYGLGAQLDHISLGLHWSGFPAPPGGTGLVPSKGLGYLLVPGVWKTSVSARFIVRWFCLFMPNINLNNLYRIMPNLELSVFTVPFLFYSLSLSICW